MNTLVTGAAGFIGFHVVKRLIERGDNVYGLDGVNDYYDVNLKYGRLNECGISSADVTYNTEIRSSCYDNYRFIQLNLEDRDRVAQWFTGERFDRVCHLAAQAGVRYSLTHPYAYIDSNIVGFMTILECCRHAETQHLVYASSSSVYGLNSLQPFSTAHNADHPVSLYAASKKSNELMAHTYSYLYQLPATGLRFFTVYGPWGRPDMALFLFTKAILEDRPIDVFNNGKMERDFTYIDDIVEGIVRVLDGPPKNNPEWDSTAPDPATSSAPFRVYNIGNSQPVKLMDFITAIEKKLGKTAAKNFLPMQAGDVPSTYADVSGLQNDFLYQPKTAIADGVSRFIDWYRDYYQV